MQGDGNYSYIDNKNEKSGATSAFVNTGNGCAGCQDSGRSLIQRL